ncbi:MAG: glycosyltransferase family 39 protein [Candidatus Nanopelagicales bacterium]
MGLLALAANGDVALGPYYFLMWPWHLPSESLVWIRRPSALAMAGAAAVTFVLGRRMADQWSGLFAAASMIAIPLVSRFAQEVRPYALVTLAATLTAYSWWRMCESRRRRWMFAYVAAALLMGLLHAYSVLILGALLLATLVVRECRDSLRSLVVLDGLMLVGLSPFFWLLSQKATGPASTGTSAWAR